MVAFTLSAKMRNIEIFQFPFFLFDSKINVCIMRMRVPKLAKNGFYSLLLGI